MKKLFTLILMVVLHLPLFSQTQILNNGFENWTNLGSSMNPNDWATANQVTFLCGNPVTVFRSTDKYSGNYALKIISVSGTLATQCGGSGVLDTFPGMASLKGNILTNPMGGMPFTVKPDSLVGFIKGKVIATNDFCYVEAKLSKWNSTERKRNIIASAVIGINNDVNQYFRMAVPFNYNSSETPDTISVVISAGNPYGIVYPGNEFFVDDLQLIYNATSINSKSNSINNIQVFLNSESTIEIIKNNTNPNKFELFDITGKMVYQKNIQDLCTKINITTLNESIYLYCIYDNTTSEIKIGKLLFSK